LRRWLAGAQFESARQLNGDRVVRLEFTAIDPRWDPPEDPDERQDPPRRDIALVAELAGRVGNLFLLDEEDRILGRQTDEAIAGRSFETGDTWSAPPPPPDPSVGSTVRWDLEACSPDTYERSNQVAEHYEHRRRQSRARQLQDALRQALEDRIDQLDRRIEHIHNDLERVQQADDFRRRAELLQSAHGQVERGAESVTVQDFYNDMADVEISLDPKKSLQQNIDRLFHQASRYEEAEPKVRQRLDDSKQLRSDAREALEDVDELAELDALQTFRDDLEQTDVLESAPRPGERSTESSDGDSTADKPYRQFRAESGATILVGRGAADNDELTSRYARGRDIWLHARDWPGAHVVLRIDEPDGSPSQQDLLDAATLAAHFSQGSADTVVDVQYTRAKHVRKPKGLPPGRVFVANESNIAVRIEDDRLQRLRDTE
jgi:predicted ribosome quality control (RQC) complex YloA/Tae2 family protein